MGVNDGAWEELFERHGIAETLERDGFCRISADSIRALREPRLMTKFDHAVNLPRIFAENGLAILPVSRREYVISSFRAYAELPGVPSGAAPRVVRPPAWLQSLSSRYVTSEAAALHYAGACGIWEDFLAEEAVVPTASGRMGSGGFACMADTARGELPLVVRNAQIEIDIACEGRGCLAIIEAKMDLSEDFHIRQLYYPFRLWRERVDKPVRCVFLNYSDGVFLLYEYAFADPMRYNSLSLVRAGRYVAATDITRRDLEALLDAALPAPEPREPFPQADNFARVVNLLELLAARSMSPEEISSAYSFTPRQAAYYSAAGRYLGLAVHAGGRGGARHELSERGRRIMGLPLRERKLALAAAILEHAVFRETLRAALAATGGTALPPRGDIVRIMRRAGRDGRGKHLHPQGLYRAWLDELASGYVRNSPRNFQSVLICRPCPRPPEARASARMERRLPPHGHAAWRGTECERGVSAQGASGSGYRQRRSSVIRRSWKPCPAERSRPWMHVVFRPCGTRSSFAATDCRPCRSCAIRHARRHQHNSATERGEKSS